MIVEDKGDFVTEQPMPKVESILDRRNQLKRQRRNRFVQSLWRMGATLGMAVALGWGLSQPEWKIRSLSQISILGNTQISTQTLERLLPITYPSSLIRVQPQAIARQLQSLAHIERVTVTRQLFPPHINIVIQERSPVAKLQCSGCLLTYEGKAPFQKSDTWLVDSAGVVLPLESYPELQRSQSLPTLTIEGYLTLLNPKDSPNRLDGKPITVDPVKQRQLQKMLPLLLASPMTITQLDWRDPNNLKLKTTLGVVHLANASDSPQKLAQQLEALDKMRSIPQKIDLKTVAFLDLTDPEHPMIELNPKHIAPQAQKDKAKLP